MLEEPNKKNKSSNYNLLEEPIIIDKENAQIVWFQNPNHYKKKTITKKNEGRAEVDRNIFS
jgi:hypothetical protein